MNLHKAASEFAEAFQTSAGDIDAKLEALLDVLEDKEMQPVAWIDIDEEYVIFEKPVGSTADEYLPLYTHHARNLTDDEMQHYQCNYCGFEGKYMHGCKEYIKTLKVFKEMRG